MPSIPTKPSRLLAELAEFRQIGASGAGVARPAFSEPDIVSRALLAERMRAAGLEACVDECGNLFGLPPGDEPCLLIGSHSDSQPLGGWLDGIFGVLCGLEIARAAIEAGGPRVAVVSFQDEEGRFGGLTGSDIWSGGVDLATADAWRDAEGVTFAEARRAVDRIAPVASMPPARFTAFLEAHIEQGPVLDSTGEAIGVVEAIVGMRQASLRFVGEANHAGTTPMPLRRDAVRAAARFIHELAAAFAPLVTERTVWTHGRLTIEPNAPSIVPGVARLSLQMRDAKDSRLERMMAVALDLAQGIAAEAGMTIDVEQGPGFAPVAMSAELVAHLEQAAQARAPGRWRRMPSGALHDASNVARVLPVGMLFVPSIGGISHNPAENTALDDLAVGLETLAHAIGLIRGSH